MELITEALFAGMQLDNVTIPVVYTRLLSKGITITPMTKLKEIKRNAMIVYNVLTKMERQK